MDPRRFLILACAGLGLSACAAAGQPEILSQPSAPPAPPRVASAADAADPVAPRLQLDDEATADPTLDPALARSPEPRPVERARPVDAMPQADPVAQAVASNARPYEQLAQPDSPSRVMTGRAVSGRRAIVAANTQARTASHADAFVGGVQVFAWSPGRLFEVWTAPLRVTTLTLGAGETLVSKAAGDTVRWQIGETTSGAGPGQRTHVLLKPLERGLETNLVLTTNRRVYLLELRSGPVDGFNAAVAWDPPNDDVGESAALGPARGLEGAGSFDTGPLQIVDPAVTPAGPLDARYRIEPQGRRPRWTPAAVFNDGTRTFIAFNADLQVDEAPALFVLAPDGESQLVNYRQAGGLFIVDRLFDRAELRLGDRRPQTVRIHRLQGARP